MGLFKKLKPSNLLKQFIDQTPYGFEIKRNVLDTTYKSYFKKKFININIIAKLIQNTGTTANLKKDNTSLTFRYARIVYPIFRKEASYNLFLISLNQYFGNPIFTTDIEINNASETFYELSKEVKKKISFNYVKTTKIKNFKPIKVDYSRKENLGRFYPEADYSRPNRLILNGVNKDFIKDIYEVLRSPNCNMFFNIYLQKIKNYYLIYDLRVTPAGEFTDEYNDCFEIYSDNYLSHRYSRGSSDIGSDKFKLKIK